MLTADATRCSPRRPLPSAEFRVALATFLDSSVVPAAGLVESQPQALVRRSRESHPRTHAPIEDVLPTLSTFYRGPSRDSQRLRSTPTATVLVTPGLH